MPRRRKRPSPLRCLNGVVSTFPAFVMLWALGGILESVCHGQPQCSRLPTPLALTLLGIVAGGLCWTGYRAYRDFVKGDYWMDLADAGYL